MLNKIEEELAKLSELQVSIDKGIQEAPNGTLRCAINKGHYQYYVGKEYLNEGKREYATKLAQKEYCLHIDREVKKYQRALRKVRSLYKEQGLENIYRRLHLGRKALVTPLVRPVEDIIKEFENIEYEGKGFEKEDMTEYYTIKGERVRSKSEKIIADELYRYGIPYKYEMPLQLVNWNKQVTFYPDFTALNKRNGKKWILEHLGMMDKSSYYENAMQKLDIYEKNNILLGEGLILLHETSNNPLNTNTLRKYIEIYLC